MSTISSFKSIENIHDVYRGKKIFLYRVVRNFCESLLKCAMDIINFLSLKKMKLLINEWQVSCENAKICYICQEKCEKKYVKNKKNIIKLEIIVAIQGNIGVLRIEYLNCNIVYLKKII